MECWSKLSGVGMGGGARRREVVGFETVTNQSFTIKRIEHIS